MKDLLPNGWISSKLGEVAELVSGAGFPINYQNQKGLPLPFFKVGNLGEGKSIEPLINSAHTINKELAQSLRAKIIPENAVVFAKIGMAIALNRRRFIGKPACIDNNMMAAIPSKAILSNYLLRFLETINLMPLSQSTTVPSIRKGDLENICLPLAPLNEQRRIVAKLDKLFAETEDCKEGLNRIKKIEDRLALSFLYESGCLYPEVLLGDYCEEMRISVGTKWKKCSKIGVDKEKGIVELRVGTASKFERYKIVSYGDFIYNPMRVDIGSIARYLGKNDAITSPDYVVFRVKNTISPSLLLKFMKSSLGLAEINNNTQGSVRSRLYYQNLSKIKFPLAVKKQKAAEKILGFYSTVVQRCNEQISNLKIIEQGILSKAFRGELVPQDPNDEPAEMLLQKINGRRLN